MTEGPVIFLRLGVEFDGAREFGIASDLLPPKWFTKEPARSLQEEIAEMLQVIRRAAETALGLEGVNPFEIWWQLYQAQLAWGTTQALPPLLTNFGVSLVERALLEACARFHERPCHELVRADALGLELGRIHPELSGRSVRTLLPPQPLGMVLVRQTIGLLDPIAESDIKADERLQDGLPQSLEASARLYGLRHFKLKLSGKVEADLARMQDVAGLLDVIGPDDFAFSLDGNEQFDTMDRWREFWTQLTGREELRAFLKRLLFVEQPLARSVALGPEVGETLTSWPEAPPMIIDESDAVLEDLPRALALGYSGTSHKNCKGIFKGVANRCLLEARRAQSSARLLLMSGEDLCNIGPVALLQDLAMMATLGVSTVERNGHHYHPGLSQFPTAVQAEVLAAHGDLYTRSSAGWPTLRITNGALDLTSINQAPFGVGFRLDTTAFALDCAKKELGS